MKKLFILSAALVTSGLSLAQTQDLGHVISATPILQQVGVPRQVCSTEQVAVQQPKSGGGAILGAIAGGAMGQCRGRRQRKSGSHDAGPHRRGGRWQQPGRLTGIAIPGGSALHHSNFS